MQGAEWQGSSLRTSYHRFPSVLCLTLPINYHFGKKTYSNNHRKGFITYNALPNTPLTKQWLLRTLKYTQPKRKQIHWTSSKVRNVALQNTPCKAWKSNLQYGRKYLQIVSVCRIRKEVATQKYKDKWPNFQNGQKTWITFLQRRCTKSHERHEKSSGMISHWGSTNPNHTDIAPPADLDGRDQRQTITSIGKDMEKHLSGASGKMIPPLQRDSVVVSL